MMSIMIYDFLLKETLDIWEDSHEESFVKITNFHFSVDNEVIYIFQ